MENQKNKNLDRAISDYELEIGTGIEAVSAVVDMLSVKVAGSEDLSEGVASWILPVLNSVIMSLIELDSQLTNGAQKLRAEHCNP